VAALCGALRAVNPSLADEGEILSLLASYLRENPLTPNFRWRLVPILWPVRELAGGGFAFEVELDGVSLLFSSQPLHSLGGLEIDRRAFQ
jgi:hypothetical protein